MPFGDGTGPLGLGPRTGRGLGFCNGYNSPGFTKGAPMGRGFGFGRGRGFGFGRGLFRRGFFWNFWNREPVQLSKEEERKMVEEEIKALEEELKALKKRLEELK